MSDLEPQKMSRRPLAQLSTALPHQVGESHIVCSHDLHEIRVDLLEVPAYITIARLRVRKVDNVVDVFSHKQVALCLIEPADLYDRMAVVFERANLPLHILLGMALRKGAVICQQLGHPYIGSIYHQPNLGKIRIGHHTFF